MKNCKRKLISALFITLLSTAFFVLAPSSQADSGLDQLTSSFASTMTSTTVFFDKAASMKPISVALGTAMSSSDCLAIEEKIKTNYKIDAFHFVFEDGSSDDAMCGGQYGGESNFINHSTGISNLGLPYSMIVQVQGTSGFNPPGISNYFVDATFRVVEIDSYSQGWPDSNPSAEILDYGLKAVDSTGNVFISVYDKNYSQTGNGAPNVSGTHTIQQYIPADGSAPGILMRRTVKNANPALDYQIFVWSRADKKDWQDFQLPLTLADWGGYYEYDGKYYDAFQMPNFTSSLTVKYRGGKEFCAYGSVKNSDNATPYPTDNSAYYSCLNY